jgi:hypothetical protein
MKRSFSFLAVLAAFALGTIGFVASSGPSAAQQANETLGIGLFDGPESVDIVPGQLKRLAAAARNARPSRGECPRGSITAYAPKGDPLFQEALAVARRDAVRDALARMGVDISQFYFDHKVADETTITRDTELTYGAPRDETRPTVQIDATPAAGSRVRARQRIALNITARDETTRWESGIQTIELFSDSDGGRRIAVQAYPPHLPTCEGQPPPHTLSATYEVPPDPPLIVRLRAFTKDHTGHESVDTAEFPTIGDWYGTLTMSTFTVGRDVFRTRADIVLDQDGQGNLTGTMVGRQMYVDNSVGSCWYRMVQPNRFRVSLVGSLTERSSPTEGPTLKVFIKEIRETTLKAEAGCAGGVGGPIGPPGGWRFKTGVFAPEAFLGTPSPFGEGQVLADGARQYRFVSESAGVGTRGTVTLRRVRR